jgi:hypothetical protein
MKCLRTLPLFAVIVLAACGGGGSSSPMPVPVVQPIAAPTSIPSPGSSPTSTPTHAPTTGPTVSPTTSPTTNPTATPIPLAIKRIGGAPLTATASQLSSARRTAEAHTLAQGVENGLPILVESSGLASQWAGAQVAWVTNIANSTDVPETSGTITPSGNLPIMNPGFTPLNCIASLAAACIVHPLGWEYGTSSANGKPVGKQTLTIAFGDGTTGTTSDYVYDGWVLTCNAGFFYQAGVPVATTNRNLSDVYADCTNGNIVFPKGGTLALTPSQDAFGRFETIMPTVTSAILMSSLIVNVPMTTIANGQVFGITTQDGGFAKIYFNGPAVVVPSSPPGLISAEGLSLHAKPDGTYLF